MYKIGIDLGGTKTEIILLDNDLKTITRKRIATPSHSYSRIIQSIADLVSEIKSIIPDKNKTALYTIGVCAPGALEKQTGLIKNSNTVCLINKPLKQDLEKKLGQKIFMENDANCFALAEATLGAAKPYNTVFGAILGTGVGGGITINKKIHLGRMQIAGEWGHQTLYPPNQNPCYCGKLDCVETYISGPALERRWAQLTGNSSSTSQLLPDIITSLESNTANVQATYWKNEFVNNFGRSLANVINILDPDVVVLGGGVSNIPFLYDEGVRAIYKNVFSDLVDTPVIQNALGDSAGVFGACMLDDSAYTVP